jgi:hypothetical protein
VLTQVARGEALRQQPKQGESAEQGEDPRIEPSQRRHALPVDHDRPLDACERRVADRAVVAESLDVQQTSVGVKADLPQRGEIAQPPREVEVVGVVDRGLGAQRPPGLVVLLDARALVV